MKVVLEVADGHPPGGELVERPGSHGGMKSSPARRPTKSLRSSTTLPRTEPAITPNARNHFAHTGSQSSWASRQHEGDALRVPPDPDRFGLAPCSLCQGRFAPAPPVPP